MANSPTSLRRKCLGFVSRLGSLTPQSPPSSTGRGVGYPVPETSSKRHSVAAAVVVGASLAALIGMLILFAVLMRRKVTRPQLLNGNVAGAVEAKDGDGDASEGEDGKRSADAVELVVMAGETTPTFVAHPVPAFSDSVVVQCPPFTLPKDPQ